MRILVAGHYEHAWRVIVTFNIWKAEKSLKRVATEKKMGALVAGHHIETRGA